MHFKTFYVAISIICMKIKMGAVFSLKFSSAGKGPFMAGKAKNMYQKHTYFPGGGGGVGSRVRDIAPLLLWNLEAKFSEKSLTHF